MTQIAIHHPCKPSRKFGLGMITQAVSLLRQRRCLARLDDRALKDIGVTRLEADTEARRPVWDAPQFWHK
ncbi:DUF1127 domain-containing protein [Rhodobacteraceae bacterium B1Z28]|uniref:DUF1127 domain-containing protein n=1 Tax=Ruegeria haliotis TaxID=2747601 RepID=A0ABX2PL89_9RHOB|nr:DUF1127 domain-containing protein [Ruegeria haliotis]NVO54481.1 DUF1127 domain-containing protein [Ruegeria haliotis]